jgi:hypothetical protein
MTFINFIKDHLVNIDRVFDKHDKSDEQKPNKYTFHNNVCFQICSSIQNIEFVNKSILILSNNNFYFYQFSFSYFYNRQF